MNEDEVKKQEEARQAATLREIYARSRDIIRVTNPLATEFRFKYDSVWYKIGPGEKKDWERYLALHYFKNIKDFIIGQMIIDRGTKLVEDRRKTNVTDPYMENKMVWDKMPSTEDRDLINQIASEVILGMVEKFGATLPPEAPQAPELAKNPLNMKLDELIADKFASNTLKEEAKQPEKPIIAPITEKPKKKLETEVSVA